MLTRRLIALTLATLTSSLAACSKDPSSSECTNSSDCGTGEVCDAGNCVVLCVSDLDCAEGEVCTDSLCVPGHGRMPTIDGVDGVGTEEIFQDA